MEKINDRIKRKEEQIKTTQNKLAKYRRDLKDLQEQKEALEIKELLNVLNEKGLDINEATELLANKNSDETNHNNNY